MAKRPINVEEEFQNLIANWLRVNIDADPKQVSRFFISNIFQHTIAHVVGRGPESSIPIEATSAGELKVAAVGVGLESYDYTAHTAVDDNAIDVTFAEVVSSIDLIVEDQNAEVRFSSNGTTWLDWFTLKAGEAFKRDIVINKLEIKNTGAGLNHVARIWGYY